MSAEQTPDIEAVLAEVRATARTGTKAQFDALLTRVLAAAVREAEQRALREAAGALNVEGVGFQGGWGSNPEDQHAIDALVKAVHWLRDRADRVAVDAPEGGEGR